MEQELGVERELHPKTDLSWLIGWKARLWAFIVREDELLFWLHSADFERRAVLHLYGCSYLQVPLGWPLTAPIIEAVEGRPTGALQFSDRTPWEDPWKEIKIICRRAVLEIGIYPEDRMERFRLHPEQPEHEEYYKGVMLPAGANLKELIGWQVQLSSYFASHSMLRLKLQSGAKVGTLNMAMCMRIKLPVMWELREPAVSLMEGCTERVFLFTDDANGVEIISREVVLYMKNTDCAP